MKHTLISLCMIVKDEALHLERCLRSVQGVVDEIVVVDTGSQDATMEIARRYGATLLESPWQGDFALHRNQSLGAAHGDWILWLDADEELAAETRAALRQAVKTTQADGLRLVVRNLQPEGELCRYLDLHITRLFRAHEAVRFEGRVHEQVTPSILRHHGQIEDLDALIVHYGYVSKTAQGSQVRFERNITLLEAALSEDPADAYLLYQAGAAYKAAGDLSRAQARLQAAVSEPGSDLGAEVLTDLYMKLAQIELGQDHFAAAAGLAQTSLQAAPNNVIARYVLALACLFDGRTREAYAQFCQVKAMGADVVGNAQELEVVLAYCRQAMGE